MTVKVHCPHCGATFLFVSSDPDGEIACIACPGRFFLNQASGARATEARAPEARAPETRTTPKAAAQPGAVPRATKTGPETGRTAAPKPAPNRTPTRPQNAPPTTRRRKKPEPEPEPEPTEPNDSLEAAAEPEPEPTEALESEPTDTSKSDSEVSRALVPAHTAGPPPVLFWPALFLGLCAAIELALVIVGGAFFYSVIEPDLNRGWDQLRPQARTTITVVTLGLVGCTLKCGAVSLGSWQMWQRRRYWLALVGAVAAAVPLELVLSFVSDELLAHEGAQDSRAPGAFIRCWAAVWFGLGVWVLVLLVRRGVASQFAPARVPGA